MKDLKEYIRESIEDNTDETLKNSITKWIKSNTKSIKEYRLDFDFNTTPVTVNYDGDIMFKSNITSLTNDIFQWGEVKGFFNCVNCPSLTSLEGAPKVVWDEFGCDYCDSLKSLKGSPEKVRGDFYCSYCKSLESLEGAPKEVGGSFYCISCVSLKSLKGAPQYVEVDFKCRNCESLNSLNGAPKEVGMDFNCSECTSLTSLKGAPNKVGNDFYCGNCGVQFTGNDIEKVSKVSGEINC